MTTIISDDYFFNEKLKDEYCGNDYKEVVDQSLRKYILDEVKEGKTKENKEEEKKLHFNKHLSIFIELVLVNII